MTAQHEAAIRVSAFVCATVILVVLQSRLPRRPPAHSLTQRWTINFSMVALGTLLTRLALPTGIFALADLAQKKHWGLMNHLDISIWLALPLAVLALDLVIYLQHRAFHKIPLLWRLHRVHHTDLECDVSTGVRFHPLEFLVSVLVKCAVVLMLGPPALAVLAFEVGLNVSSLFNHANFHLDENWDHWIRRVIVTPDMHRVHHSTVEHETNSNFGFNFPWWDRLFGTYRAAPALPHETMEIGVAHLRDPKDLTALRLLAQPFTAP